MIAKIKKYLEQMPDNWDVLFDSDICKLHYKESPLSSHIFVYKKSNAITKQCKEASRGANFYMLRLESAKKLLAAYTPITDSPDFHYNHLFRKLQMTVYWAEPINVHKIKWPFKTSQVN